MRETAFPLTQAAAIQSYSSPDYHYDNRLRGDADAYVVQLTLAGVAFIADSRGSLPVPLDHAMLFSHREPSHYGYPPGDRGEYRLCYLSFSPRPEVTVMFDRIRHAFGRVVRLPPKTPARALFQELYTKGRERAFADRFEEAELIYRFLVALYREQVADSQKRDPIAYGHHLLFDQFRTPINLKEIAQRSGVSREHFNRSFHARYGESPGHMLRRLRLEHAQAMLHATELTVEDIAVACGFTSSNSFCRAYRQHVGRSPGATRRSR